MKPIKITTIALFLLCTNCKKFLFTQPLSFLPPQQYYQGSNLNNALAGVYNPLFQSTLYGGAFLDTIGMCNDEGFFGGPGRVLTTGPAVYNYNYTDAAINGMWATLYTGIERANELLYYINAKDSSAAVQAAYGEALFLRAYYHFLLVTNFGAVPLKITPTQSQAQLNIPRSNIGDVYNQIVTDMKISEGKVYSITQLGNSSRVSKSAVDGILARVYLYMAGYPYQGGESGPMAMYDSSLVYSTKVVSSGLHSLNNSYSQVFINEAEDIYEIKECIWEADFSGNNLGTLQTDGRNGCLNSIPFTAAVTYSNIPGSSDYIYLDSGYSYAFVYATQKLYGLYDSTDTRRDWAIQPFNYSFSTSSTPAVVTRVPIAPTPFAYNRSCAKWRRTYETVYPKNKSFSPENFPILRYSDVLLMQAEASLFLNGSNAVTLNAMNAVRERGHGITGGTAPIKSLTLITQGSGYNSNVFGGFNNASLGNVNLGNGLAYTSTITGGKVTAVTLTSGGSGFIPGTAGTLYLGNAWSAATSYSVNQQVIYKGYLYTVTVAGVSSSTPPTQTNGASSAAVTGAVFTYSGLAATAKGTLLTTADVDLSAVSLQNIQDERARELCFEALRVPDLIRWNIFIPTMQSLATAIGGWAYIAINTKSQIVLGYNNISEKNKLLPIPSSELTVNNKMTQNPGW